jgi:hypothetical protein
MGDGQSNVRSRAVLVTGAPKTYMRRVCESPSQLTNGRAARRLINSTTRSAAGDGERASRRLNGRRLHHRGEHFHLPALADYDRPLP